METITVLRRDAKEEKAIVYNVYDFPYNELRFLPLCRNNSRKKSYSYYNVSASFDIETTTIDGKKDINDKYITNPYAFMYQWQACINDFVVFGRTWTEFCIFIDKLHTILELSENKRIVIFVHNLAYEFQFMHDFINIKSIFAKDKRKPLYVLTEQGIEFRCSYMLSNMSLAKFCENSELCVHYKLDGESYNYSTIRTPDTYLSELEKAYCYNDVKGLCECIDTLLQEDTIASLPLTNTGYVRREYRQAMKSNAHNREIFEQTALTLDEYKLCRSAFRGGNTHANRYKANKILENVTSYDLQSSYPATIMLDEYPMGKFTHIEIKTMDELKYFMENFCMVMTVSFKNIYANIDTYIPYIDIAHCISKGRIINDNGRVLSADYITLSLTNIDLEIIFETYTYEEMYISDCIVSEKGKLPVELRNKMLDFYDAKTKLKGVEGKEYEYMKSKNRLNSTFGCMVTDILHNEILFDNGEWTETQSDKQEQLEKFYKSKNNFLCYQWGIFVTANARKRLQRMIDVVGKDIVYIDTDSIKYVNDKHTKEFEELNKELVNDCLNNDIRAYSDKDGKRYYLGIWDFDGHYKKFKTLGAKKYCYVNDDDSFHITVSGMSKNKGAKAVGTIDNFLIGKEYKDIGRTTSWYNEEKPHYISIDNCEFITASNIGIMETTYTLGITNEYAELIGFI